MTPTIRDNQIFLNKDVNCVFKMRENRIKKLFKEYT